MDHNFLIVTCIFDVKKRLPTFFKRNVDKYITLFNYILDLNLPVILFTEDHIIERIKKVDNLYIINKNLEDLKSYKLLSSINKNLKPPLNFNLDKYYCSVINSKVELMSEVSDLLSDQKKLIDFKNAYNLQNLTHLVWLDAGISHVGTIIRDNFIEGINFNSYKDKITVTMMNATSESEINNLDTFLSYNREKIAAGLSIIPINMIEWYKTEIFNLFSSVIYDLDRMCLEEQLIPILIVKNNNKFNYIYSYYWVLPNLINITSDINVIINNLTYCRNNNMIDLAFNILSKLLSSISKSKYKLSPIELLKILYDGQIISYYKNTELSKKLGILIGYLYYYNDTGKNWINEKFDNIKSNLSFVGINLEIKDNFSEGKILNEDIDGYLWSII